jgi:DNA polymerase I-like protein with 3'-5' exonuclease and polymerase domains
VVFVPQMIDSLVEYKEFLEKNKEDDLFIHFVFTDDNIHPVASKISVIFIQNFKTEELYHISISHQDSPQIIDLHTFVSDISKFNGRIFVLDKKSFIQHIPVKSALDINLGLHLKNEKFINLQEYETVAHKFIRQNYYTYHSLNKVVPLMKHREMVYNIFTVIKKYPLYGIFREDYFLKINNDIVETLSDIEVNGIYVDKDKFKKYFDAVVYDNGMVYSQYNLQTSTGRPSNRFGGVNYAALKKDDGSRECFVSRFGDNGMMVMMDYSAFHPRIIAKLTNFKIDRDINVYEYLAKLLFNKDVIDDIDIKDAKELTFRQLYGGIEEKYSHIQYFYNLKSFINDNWNNFKNKGYIKTPIFGRKITEHQIQNPNPNKLFNYILQATETEIAVPVLMEVNKFLYNRKTKSVLYTYDSILFDVCKDEWDIVKNIKDIMELNGGFPIKCYIGKSYADLKQVIL